MDLDCTEDEQWISDWAFFAGIDKVYNFGPVCSFTWFANEINLEACWKCDLNGVKIWNCMKNT